MADPCPTGYVEPEYWDLAYTEGECPTPSALYQSVYKNLLPDGSAYELAEGSEIKALFSGLSDEPQRTQDAADLAYADLFPATTRQLTEWEAAFALTAADKSDTERRQALAAAWAATGGQSPAYLENLLRGAGFDVFVFDWWVPATDPPEAQNPFSVLEDSSTAGTQYTAELGETAAELGETEALLGNAVDVDKGFLLVNGISESSGSPGSAVMLGADTAFLGESGMQLGNPAGLTFSQKEYLIPKDQAEWPWIVYVGGTPFGTLAQVPVARKDEFESLIFQFFPAHNWVGTIVEYV